MLYNYLFGIVNAFDYGLSMIWSILSLPYDLATHIIFGGDFSFRSIIFRNIYEFNVPYVTIISDTAEFLFNLLFSWTTSLPFAFNFAICLVTGIIGNVFLITVIHWCIKSLGLVFKAVR